MTVVEMFVWIVVPLAIALAVMRALVLRLYKSPACMTDNELIGRLEGLAWDGDVAAQDALADLCERQDRIPAVEVVADRLELLRYRRLGLWADRYWYRRGLS